VLIQKVDTKEFQNCQAKIAREKLPDKTFPKLTNIQRFNVFLLKPCPSTLKSKGINWGTNSADIRKFNTFPRFLKRGQFFI
jgi:hypothetical protein